MREPGTLLLTDPQGFLPTCPGNPVHWLLRTSLVTLSGASGLCYVLMKSLTGVEALLPSSSSIWDQVCKICLQDALFPLLTWP